MLTFRLMRSLAFNSVEDEDGIYCEGTKDFIKWRVRIYCIYISLPNCFNQIRSLIKQIKDYGVDEEDLFHEDDLMQRANIPRVCKCLKEIAIIVSISQEIN